MTEPQVLVAYGTSNGSTQQIAQRIGEVLERNGLRAVVRSAADVRDVRGYDAVVIGGALYAGRWHRDAVRFARRHRSDLAGVRVYLFSSGPLDPSAGRRGIPPVPSAARAARRVHAAEHVTFGGSLTEGAKGFLARRLLTSGRGGDFRDWSRIERWAQQVARAVAGTPSRA